MSLDSIYLSLLESYNRAIQKKCEESLGSVRNFSDFENLINEARSGWENTKVDGKFPGQYFDLLESEDDFRELFERASVVCDEFIPESLVGKLLGSGYISIAEEHAFGDSPVDMKNAAIKILGISQKAKYSERLIELLYVEGEYEELIKETARQALIDIGEASVPFLQGKLAGKDILSDDDFHLVIALIGIDPGHKSDEVFKTLKDSFRKTSDKALAARCLADYGDGRAVPMLRSYLEKNLHKLDESTVFEIQGAVLSLGGSTDGINIP